MYMPSKYDFQKIEKKWQKIWEKEKIYEPDLKNAKKPFYNLMMFPYPSAEGLHVGNMYAFTGADIYGRFKRMQGYDVFEPIGLDGFGIHSENYAIKIGTHPMKQIKISEKRFYKQLQIIGNGFAWDEKLETYDPEYYKWTQWIFVQMWKKGLAYRKRQAVNWCSSCKTVLADEQVIAGQCERCKTVVIKKELEQWFFRITKYAEKLLQNLDKIDWSEKVKIAQRNWIGRSEGAEIEFKIPNSKFQIEVFTTRPDTLFGATYMVLAPEHPLIQNLESRIKNLEEVKNYIKKAGVKSEEERIAEGRGKTGIELKGVKAINPANNEEIPIFVADYVLASYGTGAIMAVPAHDERDWAFAKKYDLPIKMVICPNYPAKTYPILESAYEDEGYLVGSGKFDGLKSEKAKWAITDFVGGKRQVQYRLRDWLISRQRYWGPPIPMIFCEKCGWQSVPEKDLPVKLPFAKEFRPKGKDKSPLASVKSFYETECPKCGGKARRETDVSDTFFDSAWYYLRYPSVKEKNRPWNPAIAEKWLPVNMYIGGAEHSVLHLLYVRFLAMALKDMGYLHFEEPFPKFRAHGLLISEGAKMSKSRGNVVVPDDYIKKFGADALRMYLMFLAPFEQGGDFRDAGILGIARFLERVWKNSHPYNQRPQNNNKQNKDKNLERLLHQTIKKVTEDIENLHYNTAISALMILLNNFEKDSSMIFKNDFTIFLKLLAPFAPYITEELWSRFFVYKKSRIRDSQSESGHRYNSIHKEGWPQYNPELIKSETFELVIQINGKYKGVVTAEQNINQAQAEKLCFENERIKTLLQDKRIKKTIFVANRLINFVV